MDSVQVNSSTYQAVGTAYDVGVASSSAALTQAMYAAIATNDLSQVQAVISGAASYTTPQTETTASTDGQNGGGGTAVGDGTADGTASGDGSGAGADGTGGDIVLVDPPE